MFSFFESDYSEHGIPLKEHWDFLIIDEEKLHKPIPYSIRTSNEISKMRKYLIDFIISIGDRLRQRTLTLHIAINYLGN